MRAAKHILFVAGLIGLIGMFVLLVSLGKGLTHVEVTAKELSFGLSRTHALLDKEIPPLVAKRMPKDVITGRDDVRTVIKALRGAAAAPSWCSSSCSSAYRGCGADSSAAGSRSSHSHGVASIAAYLGLRYGIDYGENEEPLLKRVELTVEVGAYLLIVAGLGGILGGALAAWRPELPRKRTTATPQPLAAADATTVDATAHRAGLAVDDDAPAAVEDLRREHHHHRRQSADRRTYPRAGCSSRRRPGRASARGPRPGAPPSRD